jgi:hypothetical protein
MFGNDTWRMAEAAGSQPERRRLRAAPRARLWPGRSGKHALLPRTWYPLSLIDCAHRDYVWVRTAYGLARVHRRDVEVRGV